MVRVGNQASNHPQDSEGINFHVSVHLCQGLLVQADQSVILLIHVQILDEAFPQEIIKVFQSKVQILNVTLLHLRSPSLHCEQWADQSASITGYVYAVLLVI